MMRDIKRNLTPDLITDLILYLIPDLIPDLMLNLLIEQIPKLIQVLTAHLINRFHLFVPKYDAISDLIPDPRPDVGHEYQPSGTDTQPDTVPDH